MALVECPYCGLHSLSGSTQCIHCGKSLIKQPDKSTQNGSRPYIKRLDPEIIYYCEDCYNAERTNPLCMLYQGYFKSSSQFPDSTKYGTCPVCGNSNVVPTNITVKDYSTLSEISKEITFFEAMKALRDTDIIEYETKMVPFRHQIKENEDRETATMEEARKRVEQELNTIKCPRCGSTSVSTGARGINYFFGPLGASTTVNRCAKCGHTWHPNLSSH